MTKDNSRLGSAQAHSATCNQSGLMQHPPPHHRRIAGGYKSINGKSMVPELVIEPKDAVSIQLDIESKAKLYFSVTPDGKTPWGPAIITSTVCVRFMMMFT